MSQVLEGKAKDINTQMGLILSDARNQKNIPVTVCAQLIKTSRRRYAAMEKGEAIIGAAELHLLADFLDIPLSKIWQAENELDANNLSHLAVPFNELGKEFGKLLQNGNITITIAHQSNSLT